MATAAAPHTPSLPPQAVRLRIIHLNFVSKMIIKQQKEKLQHFVRVYATLSIPC